MSVKKSSCYKRLAILDGVVTIVYVYIFVTFKKKIKNFLWFSVAPI